jgi:hypothetical protein
MKRGDHFVHAANGSESLTQRFFTQFDVLLHGKLKTALTLCYQTDDGFVDARH